LKVYLKEEKVYAYNFGTNIVEKLHFRDLGVELSSDLTFSTHIEDTDTGASRMVGWVMRIFRRRSKDLWKSLIQTKLYYCSELSSPNDQASISKLEGVANSFTSRVSGMEGLDYWNRLVKLGIYSGAGRGTQYNFLQNN
jgi:hypothetical protein